MLWNDAYSYIRGPKWQSIFHFPFSQHLYSSFFSARLVVGRARFHQLGFALTVIGLLDNNLLFVAKGALPPSTLYILDFIVISLFSSFFGCPPPRFSVTEPPVLKPAPGLISWNVVVVVLTLTWNIVPLATPTRHRNFSWGYCFHSIVPRVEPPWNANHWWGGYRRISLLPHRLWIFIEFWQISVAIGHFTATWIPFFRFFFFLFLHVT